MKSAQLAFPHTNDSMSVSVHIYIFQVDILLGKVDVCVIDKNCSAIVPPDVVIFPVVATMFPVDDVKSLTACLILLN